MAKRAASADPSKILKDLSQYQITRDAAQFSELEERILKTYDELEELRIDRMMWELSNQVPRDTKLSEEELDIAIKKAEREAIDARASYKVRNSIISNVLMVDPILQAIHSDSSGSNPGPTPSQLALRTLLNQRDVLALTHTNVATDLHSLRSELVTKQVQSIQAVNRNRRLATEIVELSKELQKSGAESVEDEELQEMLAESKRELALAKRSRMLVKCVVSAVVAGSGVDWAGDEELRALVLDEDA